MTDTTGHTDDEQTCHPVFQEDLMKMLHEAGDFSLREAYELIRTLAKNKSAVTDAREQFLKRAESRGLDQEQTNKLWKRVRAESHHALCKAHIYVTAFHSLQAAFVKAHHPEEFRAVSRSL